MHPAVLALTVSVAASLSDVVGDLVKRYEAAGGGPVQVNAGGSSALARQIVEGAPVDLFISADEAQMAVAAKRGRIIPGTQVTLLTNQLVVIVPKDGAPVVRQPSDLAARSVKRVAMGNPESVPAGVYGRQWLEKLGLWPSVQPKVVPMSTVRAALAAVREGRADAAIVYATDARTTSDVRVVFTVAAREGPSIAYPAALVRGPREAEARRFLAYLQSAEARAVFEAAGFGVAARR
jgi:molybdate transport system substrate-binding protein